MPIVPSVSNVGTESIESGLVKLLVTLAKDEKVRTAIDTRLEALAKRTSDRICPLPSDVRLSERQTKDARFADSVQSLAQIVAEQPLEDIAEGRRPNSRQRKVAAMSVPLWIVAREAIKQENLRPQADDSWRAFASPRLVARPGWRAFQASCWNGANRFWRAGKRPKPKPN